MTRAWRGGSENWSCKMSYKGIGLDDQLIDFDMVGKTTEKSYQRKHRGDGLIATCSTKGLGGCYAWDGGPGMQSPGTEHHAPHRMSPVRHHQAANV